MYYARCITVALCVVALFACSHGAKIDGEEQIMAHYYEALSQTDPQSMETLQPGSDIEAEAIDSFKSFYAVFSEEVIRQELRHVYAENAYFRDGMKEVMGIDALEEYFLASAETVHECIFDIQDIAAHEGNYYFRWVMHLRTKRWKDEPIQAVGMSHVRFDRKGKIVFHQDYWDTSVIYEKIPVMGSVIGWIKKRF